MIKKLLIVLVLLLATSLAGQQPPAQPVIPLLGQDPVLLTQGREVQGKETVASVYAGFKYIFASEESKATFDKDPARYAIQENAMCMRMGPAVRGNPDLYAVYKERIYLAGTDNCLKAFHAAPEKYFAPALAPWPSSPAAEKEGRALLARALEKMGGAARIDALTSYSARGVLRRRSPQGMQDAPGFLAADFSGRMRQEYTNNSPRGPVSVVFVVNAADSFVAFGPRAYPMGEEQRATTLATLERHPLWILRARASSGFRVAHGGRGQVGDAAVEHLLVEAKGRRFTLAIDASGTALAVSYTQRGPDGDFGRWVDSYSDYRDSGGVLLPFAVSSLFNGTEAQSAKLEKIEMNGKLDAALWEKPKPPAP